MKEKNFIIVGALAVIAIFVLFTFTTNTATVPVFHVVKIQGEPYYDTSLLTRLDLEERLGDDIPALTGTELRSLGDQIVTTKEDTSRLFQVLRFTKSPDFLGGRISYTRNDEGEVGDFLTFDRNEPLFELEMTFSPGLKTRIEDNDLIDYESEHMNILGGDFNLVKGELRGGSDNIVKLTFIGDTYIEFKDDYTDNIFSESVDINGKHVDAEVKIKGIKAGSRFILTSIFYRPLAKSNLLGNVYVPPKRPLKAFLREPKSMLTRNFEIVYGGLRSTTRTVQPRTTTRRGSGFDILPTSDESYDLTFTNNRGQRYKIPLMETSNGGLIFGDADSRLKYVEGTFNINQGDYFIVTSREKTSGITNVLDYDAINFNSKELFINDLAGGQKTLRFDDDGNGIMSFGGSNYNFQVSSTPPHPISVDMNKNGNVGSGEAKIILAGGPKLDIGSSNIAGSSQSMSLTIPKKLFTDGSGSDEVVTFSIVNDNGEINIVLRDQSELDLEKQAGYNTGMTRFGALWSLYDRRDPAELTVVFGGARPSVAVTTTGGQAQGFVIVTLQLDELMALARR